MIYIPIVVKITLAIYKIYDIILVYAMNWQVFSHLCSMCIYVIFGDYIYDKSDRFNVWYW